MSHAKSLWEKLQDLHILIVNAGGVIETIRLHPDTLAALEEEMAPRPRRGEVFSPNKITGATTHAGYVNIVADPTGVTL